MWKLLNVNFLALLCIACSQENVANQPISGTTSLEAKPTFILNSDGSKTYFSSIEICAKGIPSLAKVRSCFGGGSIIEFRAEGSGFIGFDKNSLVIDQLAVNDIDISKGKDLLEIATLEGFSRASDLGRYAIWSINIKSGYHSAKDKLKVSGHVTALKAESLVELKSEVFDINDFNSFKLGSIVVQGTRITFKNSIDDSEQLSDLDKELIHKAMKKSEELGDNLTKEKVKSVLKELGVDETRLEEILELLVWRALPSSPHLESDDKVYLILKEDFSLLERIALYDGETRIKHSGYYGGNGQRTYYFNKPTSTNLTLKIHNWKNPERVKLNFDY